MTSARPARAKRVGSTNSPTRTSLLDHALTLMLEQGYAAVSYRSLAARAAVASSLVQYYFPVLDDLFVALLQRNTEQVIADLRAEPATEKPLRAVWKSATSRSGTRLLLEFMALANHRETVHQEMERCTSRIREVQLDVVSRAWAHYGLDDSPYTPASLLFIVNALPRMMLLEQNFGAHTGHTDTVRLIEQLLDRIEPGSPNDAT